MARSRRPMSVAVSGAPSSATISRSLGTPGSERPAEGEGDQAHRIVLEDAFPHRPAKEPPQRGQKPRRAARAAPRDHPFGEVVDDVLALGFHESPARCRAPASEHPQVARVGVDGVAGETALEQQHVGEARQQHIVVRGSVRAGAGGVDRSHAPSIECRPDVGQMDGATDERLTGGGRMSDGERAGAREDDSDPSALSIEAARTRVLEALSTIVGSETLPAREARGRVLAADVPAPMNVPRFRASAMDGYALRHEERDSVLTVVGRSLAGHPGGDRLEPGGCVRITTGARVPDEADTVVQQENVALEGDRVRLLEKPRRGLHVRAVGSDSERGTTLLARNTPPGRRGARPARRARYRRGGRAPRLAIGSVLDRRRARRTRDRARSGADPRCQSRTAPRLVRRARDRDRRPGHLPRLAAGTRRADVTEAQATTCSSRAAASRSARPTTCAPPSRGAATPRCGRSP